MDFILSELTFSLNQKADVYIGFPESKPNPLGNDFKVLLNIKFIDEKLSVLKVPLEDQSAKPAVQTSTGYKIYKKSSVSAGAVLQLTQVVIPIL